MSAALESETEIGIAARIVHKALPPSARYERRVGVSLVRAAWERRPEGPAYLLSTVKLD